MDRLVRQENRGYNQRAFGDRDLIKIGENLYDLYDFVRSTETEREFESRWEPDVHHDLDANRHHLERCSICSDGYLLVTNGIDAIYLPRETAYQIAYDEYVEVTERETSGERKRRANRRSQALAVP